MFFDPSVFARAATAVRAFVSRRRHVPRLYVPPPDPDELDAAGLAEPEEVWDMDDLIALGPNRPIPVYTLAIDGSLVPDEEEGVLIAS